MVNDDGTPKIQITLITLLIMSANPVLGHLLVFVVMEKIWKGRSKSRSVGTIYRNGAFWHKDIPEEGRFFKMANMAYQNFAVEIGIYDTPQPYTFQIYSEVLQKFQLAANGHGDVQPPEHLREQIRNCFTPLPTWYAPFEEVAVCEDEFPLHALTQRPMAMYHSWGSQNPWLRQMRPQSDVYSPCFSKKQNLLRVTGCGSLPTTDAYACQSQ